MYRHEIVKADQHLGVQDVRQSVRTVILPMFPRTVPKCCLLNFREEKTERSLFKLLLTDLSQQILKLVDQLYARNIAEIAYIGQQYIEIGNIVNLVLTPMMGECLGDQRGERYADYCVSKHNGFGGCLFMIGKA